MRILLDENFPVDYAKLLPGHDVATVHSLGWAGTKNGELLRRASDNNVCEVFITLDRNLIFQHNTKKLSFGIIVVRSRSSRMIDLAQHITAILDVISVIGAGQFEIIR